MWVKHSKPQPTDDKLSMKCSLNFNTGGPNHILGVTEDRIRIVKFLPQVGFIKCYQEAMGVVMVTSPFLNFTVYHDAARRAGSPGTADICINK